MSGIYRLNPLLHGELDEIVPDTGRLRLRSRTIVCLSLAVSVYVCDHTAFEYCCSRFAVYLINHVSLCLVISR